MKLKFSIADLKDVIGPLQAFYVEQDDGTYHLDVDGHPDASKVKEFRDKNVALMQERDALKTKVEASEAPDVVKLKEDLAEAQSKAAAAEAATVALTHRSAVSTAFLAHGGRAEAVDYIVSKAPADVTKLDEWLLEQTTASAFAFKPSVGGGASGGAKPTLGMRTNPRELRDPTPNQLGQHASDIASGKLKVVYTNEVSQ